MQWVSPFAKFTPACQTFYAARTGHQRSSQVLHLTYQEGLLEQSSFKSAQSDLQVFLCLADCGVVVGHVADYRVAPDGGRKLDLVSAKIDPGVNLQNYRNWRGDHLYLPCVVLHFTTKRRVRAFSTFACACYGPRVSVIDSKAPVDIRGHETSASPQIPHPHNPADRATPTLLQTLLLTTESKFTRQQDLWFG